METDFNNMRWIQNNCWPLGAANDHTLKVGQIIPPFYEAYCRILHPFYTDTEQASWKSMAHKYGIYYYDRIALSSFTSMFNKNESKSNILFPDDWLPNKQLMICLKVIDTIFPNEVLSIFSDQTDHLTSCRTTEAIKYFDNNFRGSLYLKDIFIIHAHDDLPFTLAGGTAEFINTLAESDIETLPCTSSTRIDLKSDEINLQRI